MHVALDVELHVVLCIPTIPCSGVFSFLTFVNPVGTSPCLCSFVLMTQLTGSICGHQHMSSQTARDMAQQMDTCTLLGGAVSAND